MASKKKRSKKSYEPPAIQLWDGSWYKIDDGYWHECCDCGLVHDVDYKLENGIIFMRWHVNKRQTKSARKLRDKK